MIQEHDQVANCFDSVKQRVVVDVLQAAPGTVSDVDCLEVQVLGPNRQVVLEAVSSANRVATGG